MVNPIIPSEREVSDVGRIDSISRYYEGWSDGGSVDKSGRTLGVEKKDKESSRVGTADRFVRASDAFSFSYVPAPTAGPTRMVDTGLIDKGLQEIALSMTSVIDQIAAVVKSLGLASDSSVQGLASTWKLISADIESYEKNSKEAYDKMIDDIRSNSEKAGQCGIINAVLEIVAAVVSIVVGVAQIVTGGLSVTGVATVIAGVALLVDGTMKLTAASAMMADPQKNASWAKGMMANGMFAGLGEKAGIAQLVFQMVTMIATLATSAPAILASDGAIFAARFGASAAGVFFTKLFTYAFKAGFLVNEGMQLAGQAAQIQKLATFDAKAAAKGKKDDDSSGGIDFTTALGMGLIGVIMWAILEKAAGPALRDKLGKDGAAALETALMMIFSLAVNVGGSLATAKMLKNPTGAATQPSPVMGFLESKFPNIAEKLKALYESINRPTPDGKGQLSAVFSVMQQVNAVVTASMAIRSAQEAGLRVFTGKTTDDQLKDFAEVILVDQAHAAQSGVLNDRLTQIQATTEAIQGNVGTIAEVLKSLLESISSAISATAVQPGRDR